MTGFFRASAALVAMLLIGFVVGVACNQAASKSASAAEKASGEDGKATPTKKAATSAKVKRFGSVVGLKKDKRKYYNKLHANPWPEINAMIKKCNIRNFSIYETEIDGKLYLFSYFEYTGDDFKADMKKMAADPMTQKWWKECDPCQIRLPDTPEGEQWKSIPEVYHLD